MNESEAYAAFLRMRWPGGEPVCPSCGSRKPYHIRTRKKFKCRDAVCGKQFSATSGTAFSSRKLSFSDIMSMAESAQVEDISSNEAAKASGTQWRTANSFFSRLTAITGSDFRPTRSQKTTPISSSYPYAAKRDSSTPDYLRLIEAAIPVGVPDHLRSDMCQDMVLDILEGVLAVEDIEKAARSYMRKVFKMHDLKYRNVSLNQPVPGTDTEWIQTLRSDCIRA